MYNIRKFWADTNAPTTNLMTTTTLGNIFRTSTTHKNNWGLAGVVPIRKLARGARQAAWATPTTTGANVIKNYSHN
jgi:hypothetical protein